MRPPPPGWRDPRTRRQSAPGHTAPDWPGGVSQQVHLDFGVEDLATAGHAATDAGATRLRPTEAPSADTSTGSRVYASPAGHPFCLRGA
ncbi:VOC family protein [Streptomyces sp. NPDC091272]|uniref:VOC family protein n=1 Tax=Streptomyces sp. NPDC091272 TaxID=3365981 RepID=UPI00380EC7EE